MGSLVSFIRKFFIARCINYWFALILLSIFVLNSMVFFAIFFFSDPVVVRSAIFLLSFMLLFYLLFLLSYYFCVYSYVVCTSLDRIELIYFVLNSSIYFLDLFFFFWISRFLQMKAFFFCTPYFTYIFWVLFLLSGISHLLSKQ